ncbi:MAG: signal peptide peptidase SppA [Bacteroidales bacterium]|jgi:protease-4|nr:signal peptide peptidase SppA [Bacteroidales bacterium]
MLKFLKYLLASVLGCFIALFLLFLVMIGMMSALSSFADKPVTVSDNSILKIELNTEIVENVAESSFPNFDYTTMRTKQVMGLSNILSAIKRAKDDDNIKGIYLNLTTIPAGFAVVEEIRNALADFKKSDKFILSYSDEYTQKSYYLASIADKVYINSVGDFLWRGAGVQMPFFKHALDKLDIEIQIIRHGKFKSAIEPLILDEMSKENREQTLSYVSSIWNCVLDKIAEARGVTTEQLNAWADGLEIYDARTALKKGLVDGLVYYDTVLDELKEKTGVENTDDINFISLSKYIKADKLTLKKRAKQKIAVIYAEGDIVMGDGTDEITSEGLSKTIRQARQDTTIKAIVLRINSGGGSALASDIISREVSLATEVKPVIASFSDVAASGGYYIASQADVIVADYTTITGSIGVFGVIPNFKGFMNKKLGLTFDRVTTNRFADYQNLMRPLSAEERDVLQRSVEDVYDTFLTRVSEGRHIPVAEVDEIGQGRVWSAVDAKRLKLVDELGGLNDAIRIAAEKAGLDDYSLEYLPKQQGTWEALLSSLSEEVHTRTIRAELGDTYRYYRQMQNVLKMKGIQARLPYEIELY